MDMDEKKQKHGNILPVFFWIFLVATVAVLLILTAVLLSRNGTLEAWKARYTEWKESKEATKRAETAGEKTVHYFGPTDSEEYESWFSVEGNIAGTEGGREEKTEPDPLREALTVSPVNGSEAWWSEAVKLSEGVTLYAQGKTPLYGSPDDKGKVVGYGSAEEMFSLLAVLKNGWYVVSDGQFYYCSRGEHYTLVRLQDVNPEEIFTGLEQQKVFHEVDTVLQNPELPHGCEVTGLASLFSYYDIEADKCELADNRLPKGIWGETDFRKAFIGDPRKKSGSAGCFAPVIAETANLYLTEYDEGKGVGLTAVAKENVLFSELLSMVEKAPVLAWTTMNLQAPYIAQVWEVEGEELYWQNLEHCVVLTGYDAEKEILYGTDPLYGPCEYDIELFSVRFQTMYSQVVYLTEDTP